jgi:hypothetical protein
MMAGFLAARSFRRNPAEECPLVAAIGGEKVAGREVNYPNFRIFQKNCFEMRGF